MKRPVYLAGDMLYKGSIMLRDLEKEQLRSKGVPVYVPHEDKEINDKANQSLESNSGLAEKIVYKDTLAIKKADTVVIEPQRFAEGTLVELGQIKAYNEMRSRIVELLEANEKSGLDLKFALEKLVTEEYPHKEVYAHCEDIRRTDIPEVGDRRSFGVNQYVYGVVLELTEGKGFTPFEEIVDRLKEKYND